MRTSTTPVAAVCALLLTGFLLTPLPAAAENAAAAGNDAQQLLEPRVFAPGVISSDLEEYRISFTPNGRTAFFARSEEFFPTGRSTILVSHLGSDGWSEPQPASFSGVHSDIDPFVTHDGRRLYFSSIRPVDGEERQDVDLWRVERQGNSWGEPQHLGDLVNSPQDELYPSVSRDGTLYFASSRPGGHGIFDLYRSPLRADGTYGPAENLGPALNREGLNINPTIDPSGRILFFAHNALTGPPFGDIYVSVRVGKAWTAPVSVGGGVNTDVDEYHPSLSARGDKFFFVRHDGTDGDIYWLPTWALLLP